MWANGSPDIYMESFHLGCWVQKLRQFQACDEREFDTREQLIGSERKKGCRGFVECLEALSVDNGWSRLVILLLGDPHLLEGGERSKNRSSDPDRVFSLWWGNDLDLHG